MLVNQHETVIAAFDFDGTITYCDSFIPFLMYVVGKAGFLKLLPKVIPQYLAYKCGKIGNQQAKEKFIRVYLGGYAHTELQGMGHRFAAKTLPLLVRKNMLARLQWHKQQGHVCVLISASLDVYLEAWAREHAFDAVISSRLALDGSGHVNGKLVGDNCYGAEKVRRFREWLGSKTYQYLYVYGDSRGDYNLLDIADEGFLKEKLFVRYKQRI